MSLVTIPAPGAQSPFVGADYPLQFAWDSVSIGTALSCWRKYQLAIIEGWTASAGTAAIALDFGILFHSGVEFYHVAKAAGKTHDEAVFASARQLLAEPRYTNLPTFDEVDDLAEATPDDDDGITLRNSKIRTRYHLLRAVLWYLDHYETDPAQTVILPSGEAAVELSFRVEFPFDQPNGDPYILAGHLDRVVTFQKQLYVADYKTTKSLSSQFFSSWALSHQLTGYHFGGSVVMNEPLGGVLVDGIALQVGGVKFGRAPSPRTPGQVEEYFANVRWLTTQAEHLANSLAADHSFEYPMNTQSCYFCEFKEICRQPPEFRRRYLKMNFTQQRAWNPLENR